MSRDHLLGWHHHAHLIADSMPAPVRPCPVRLVPVTERVGVADVDPVKAAGLKKRAKEAEQDAFEVWLARVRPDGDVESVQQQWEDSSDYADFLEAQEKPAAAPASVPWVRTSDYEVYPDDVIPNDPTAWRLTGHPENPGWYITVPVYSKEDTEKSLSRYIAERRDHVERYWNGVHWSTGAALYTAGFAVQPAKRRLA